MASTAVTAAIASEALFGLATGRTGPRFGFELPVKSDVEQYFFGTLLVLRHPYICMPRVKTLASLYRRSLWL